MVQVLKEKYSISIVFFFYIMNSQLNLTGFARDFVDTFFFEPPIISFHVLTGDWLADWLAVRGCSSQSLCQILLCMRVCVCVLAGEVDFQTTKINRTHVSC